MWNETLFSQEPPHEPPHEPRKAGRAKPRAAALLAGLALAGTAAATGGSDKVIDGFAGPLFGLTAVGPTQLLVADSSVGTIPVGRNGRPGAPVPLPGVTDMSADPFGTGTLWAVTGAIGGPGVGTENDTGQGVHLIVRGKAQKIANLFAFEQANNPHTAAPPNAPDSNPYDIQALGPHAAVLVDAGGNDLLRVDRNGNLKLMAVFPDEVVPTANIKSLAGCPASGASFCSLPDAIPAQPVPTSIAIDKRGYIYVGELKGFPAPSGESNIWRISPNASGARCGSSPDCVKVFDGGFTSIIDLAFGPDGLLYVTELDEGSWAAVEIFGTPHGGTINACSVQKGFCYEVEDDIPVPTAIAFDKTGALWSTRNSLTPGGGEVVKVRNGARKWWWHPHFFFHR
jgi:hypothetical protein